MKSAFIVVAIVMSLFGFAGGGGSSSDSGGGGGYSGGDSYSGGSSYSSSGDGEFTWEGFLVFLFIIGVAVPIIMIDTKKLKRRNHKEAMEIVNRARELDASDRNNTEQEKWIHTEAERIFRKYQEDWSNYNLEGIREYTTDRYYQHACLMLEAIDKMNRRNVVSDLSVAKVYLFTQVNDEYDLPMKVQVMFSFGGTDGIMDTKSNHIIHSDKARGVTEYWDFVYNGKALLLDGITQSTESTPHLVDSIAEFAKEKQLFYSPDWGRLALPTEGLIFNGWGLTSADVNNHVVGRWGDCLIQMYTYSLTPTNPLSYYLVGQINVPKSYEGVIIEAKKAKLRMAKPETYEAFKMEWEDFNRHYKVYAASKDALPAFELLNPAFMERLYERDLPYNLEVKGNTICIFAKVRNAKKENYAEMLEVLTEAYKELKA